jgi:exopolyphosphatase/guanosine-5'-triphosphate,3'-diphosphate pyrophosphatase
VSWVAVVDVGSATTKLLLTDGTVRVRRSVDTLMGGCSLSPAGQVRPEAISAGALDRVAGALGSFAGLIEERQASRVQAVATAAARQATNRSVLAGLVSASLGTELEVIDEADEARLSFLGAVSDPALVAGHTGQVVTIDIGGASTELAVGTPARPERSWSMPIGGMLLTGAYLASDPPRPEELSAALSVVELHLDDVRREEPELTAALGSADVLGLGAVTTVAAIEVGLAGDDPGNGEGDGPLHGFELSRAAVEDVFRTIATESRSDRAHNPGLPPSRVDAIVGACAILVETMRRLDLGHLVVSQRGLLDGVARELTGYRS